MSHFAVLVVLPKETPMEDLEAKLGEVLEPWNENTQVEEYRKYEEAATPAAHWQYKYVYEGALPGADDKPVTWAQYIPALNEHNEGTDDRFHDVEMDRAYGLTTYNPNSKWDWWRIGGRWRNSLLAKPNVDASALVMSPPHYTEQYGNVPPTGRGESGGLHCDAARLCDVDLEAMLASKVTKATADYDSFLAAITPELLATTKPWPHFFDLTQAGEYGDDADRLNAEMGYSKDDKDFVHPRDLARAAYRAQPGIARLNEDAKYKTWFSCPIEHFKLGRTEYIKREAANFLPGYAMVTLDGTWLASGDMGWWGMGSDTEGTVDAFKQDAKTYLRDQVDQESILVLVDCHI